MPPIVSPRGGRGSQGNPSYLRRMRYRSRVPRLRFKMARKRVIESRRTRWPASKYSAGDRKERDDFTPEERKLILSLAREAEPHIYWVNWVCSFLGTRTSEVADASTLDIECIHGIWVMSIDRKHRSRDQRLKTKVSTRKLALHGALLDEGFLDYWRSLPLGGPLFPNVPLDTYGKRASKVTTECSIWLRNVAKITDPNKSFCHTGIPRLPTCATPACRMDHPPSKKMSSATSS